MQLIQPCEFEGSGNIWRKPEWTWIQSLRKFYSQVK